MNTPTAAERPASDSPGTASKILGELRRSAPEIRAVLAGLLVVLGAWVGPGLQREVAGAEEAAIAATEVAAARPVVGGEAYTSAVQTAAGVVPFEADAGPVATDED